MDVLRINLEHMNMTFVYVPIPEGFEVEEGSVKRLFTAMIAKEAYIDLGSVTRNFLYYTSFDFTNSHFTTKFRWYVPCPVKYQRWSSVFRILSAELWIVLIISIVFAAISTTIFGQYSCTSEWQGYRTLTSSLTNVWAVILGVAVSTMPRTPSLRSLFLAWVCFSVAFSTVFQAFLTTYLIDSGYKTPLQNMEELFASGIMFAYRPDFSFVFEIGDETEVTKIQRHLANCPSGWVCEYWAKHHKNVSIFLTDITAEFKYAIGDFVGENSKPLLCKLEDGVVFPDSLTMKMFHGDPLMRQVNDIIHRVVEAGLYKYWFSFEFNWRKIVIGKIGISHPLDGYYSFKLYHLQTVFYLLLMGWCLSALCFIFEVFYIRLLSKIMWSCLYILRYVGFKFGGFYTVLRHPRAIMFCPSTSQWWTGGFLFPHHKLFANIIIYKLRIFFWERKLFKLKINRIFVQALSHSRGIMAYKGIREIILLFISTALEEVEVWASRPGRSLTPRRHATHDTGGCVFPRAGLHSCENLPLTGFRCTDLPSRSQSL